MQRSLRLASLASIAIVAAACNLLNGNKVETTATPVFFPAAGTFTGSVTVTLACSTPGASIYYTTDGKDPATASTPYPQAGIVLTTTTTIKAIASAPGFSSSAVASAAYTLAAPSAQVATPTFYPASGSAITAATAITISCSTSGATIYYSIDSSDPSDSSPTSTAYVGPFGLDSSATVKARAYASGYSASDIASAAYTFGEPAPTLVATPTISPSGGNFNLSTSVSIACSTPGALIYYSTNESAPSSSSTPYDGPFTISASTTVKAIALAAGLTQSEVAMASLTKVTPKADAPAFAPAAGSYLSLATLILALPSNLQSDSTAAIYYTTDGSAPSSASTKYTAPFDLTKTAMVKAIATADGYLNSDPASATYTISYPKAEIPIISPPGSYSVGGVNGSVTVSLACATPGAAIYYTMDDTVPTANSTKYEGPFILAPSLSTSIVVQAIALAAGYDTSDPARSWWAITPYSATPTVSPASGSYENSVPVTITCSDPYATIWYSTGDGSRIPRDGSYGSSPVTFTLDANCTVRAITERSGFAPSPEAGARYYSVYTIGTVATPYVYAQSQGGYDGTTYADYVDVAIDCGTTGASVYYTTDGSDPTASSNPYNTTFRLSSSATIKAKAFKDGSKDSAIYSTSFVIKPQLAAPTMSPDSSSSLPDSATVTIALPSGTPAGAQIRYIAYASDGSSLPMATASDTLYTGPITLTSMKDKFWDVSAVVVAEGCLTSQPTTRYYRIRPSLPLPSFDKEAGTYADSVTLTISAAVPSDAYVLYSSSDGSASGTSLPATFKLSKSATVSAWIYGDDSYYPSAPLVRSYLVCPTAAKPTLTPSSDYAYGYFRNSMSVSLACTTSGTTIRYTTDGSEPGESSTAYTTPVVLSEGATVKAKAFGPSLFASETASSTYEMRPRAATPMLTNGGSGTVDGKSCVYVKFTAPEANLPYTDEDKKCFLYFTTDGSEPTTYSQLTYGNYSIAFYQSCTVKAKLFAASGLYSDSLVGSIAITLP